jgi:hypothetical protein
MIKDFTHNQLSKNPGSTPSVCVIRDTIYDQDVDLMKDK